MDGVLEIRAGRRALALLRDRGLDPADVAAWVGPASGPRWLALVGLDRACLERGFATSPTGGRGRLVVGASAGAWRALAFASPDPEGAHARLVRGYVRQAFPRGVGPETVTAAYRRMLREVAPPDDVEAVLANETTRLAMHAVRLRGPWPWTLRAVQAAAVFAAAGVRRAGLDPLPAFAERVLFHVRPDRFDVPFDGRVASLSADNLHDAALASGTVPLYLRPVVGIPGAPPGAYVDGGLADYHLRQRYVPPGEGIVLFPHFQRDVLPGWFDRHAPIPPGPLDALDDVVQIHPDPRWIATLPDGRLPDRDDFFRFVDDPGERIRRWSEVVARSDELGEAFLRALDDGTLVERAISTGAPRGG